MTDNTAFELADDLSVTFTLTYLEIIERNLKISYSSQGEPECIPSNITINAIANLTYELKSLLDGNIGRDAIKASKIYGKQYIQSIGFGHVSDFDALIKIGLLSSARVIIWDILCSRILKPNSYSDISKSVIADIACNLLLLRSVVKLGGVVVLPHPLMWSDKARNIQNEISSAQGQSPATLGLLFALIAIDEGLPLHPFTLVLDKDKPVVLVDDAKVVDVRYSSETHNFSFLTRFLMERDEFSFLRNIKVDDFYRIITGHSEFYRALRKQFSSLAGKSPPEAQKEMESIYLELKKLSTDRDKSIANYQIDGTIASVSVVTSAITMATSPAGATFIAILGIAPSVITAARRWLARPSENVIVQAFSDLRSARPFTFEIPTELAKIQDFSSSIDLDPDLIKHVEAIQSQAWTENAHQYLEELDRETAVKVLNSLGPEQFDQLVNFRSRQEDYIGDYLEYVWGACPSSFWRHLDQMFMSNEGMLMYDGDGVHEVLTSEDMPTTVWMTLLNFIPAMYFQLLENGKPLRYKSVASQGILDFQIEQMVEVISYQLTESNNSAEKQVIFSLWLSNLIDEERAMAEVLLKRIFPIEMPNWVSNRA